MLPLLLATMRSGDPRLDVEATLLQPHATYAELGAWVQKATGVPVYVVPEIRERKATVLVENRPVWETMDRVADAFFVEWEPTREGYTLRLLPEVARDEARQAAEEDRLAREGLLRELDETARLSGLDDAALDDDLREAQRALKAAKGTDAEGAASDRASRIESMRVATGWHEVGRLLAGMSDAERRDLLSGGWAYASHPTIPGTRPLSGDLPDDKPIVLQMRVKPGSNELYVWRRTPTGTGGFPIGAYSTKEYRKAVAALPMSVRMAAWTKADTALLATPLGAAKRPTARHEKGARSLADLLVSLHERTGLPIVADGFRESLWQGTAGGGADPNGKDVAGWLGSFRAVELRPKPLARASGGWLLLRRRAYWQRLPREIPERVVRRLEAAVRTPSGATIKDYAAFAGSLSRLQGENVDADRSVMDAPEENLATNVPFLRLWDALPPALRAEARRTGGVSVSALDDRAQALVRDCLEASLNDLTRLDLLPYALPGGSPLPGDLRVKAQGRALPLRFAAPRVFVGTLGSPATSLATYSVPLDSTKP